MDRIQAALARARDARRARLSGLPAAPSSAPLPAVVQPPRPDAWQALPGFAPSPETLARHRVVTRESGPKSVPFDVLRTRVVQQMRQGGWRRLAITSPGPGCGKSTVTMNLAYSLARLEEMRVVVVDFDLRRPAMARMLGFDGGHAITHVLRGRAELENQMVRVAPNLAFATTRTAVRDPAELLQGGRVQAMLDRVAEVYAPDILLFDLPPVMVSDDAIAFLPLVDCALMVAAAEQSTLGQVDNCEREIAQQTAMLGVVLNKCSHPGEGYGYGYGYDYATDAPDEA